jgi:hypothetical protein
MIHVHPGVKLIASICRAYESYAESHQCVHLHHTLADAEAQTVPTRLGREVEGSFDYVATGLPKGGDRVGGVRFVDDASPWSFSLVFVLPIAPL